MKGIKNLNNKDKIISMVGIGLLSYSIYRLLKGDSYKEVVEKIVKEPIKKAEETIKHPIKSVEGVVEDVADVVKQTGIKTKKTFFKLKSQFLG